MLKPRGKINKKAKPLAPLQLKTVDVKEKDKPAEIIMSLVNGHEVFINADTGEVIDNTPNRYTPAYEVFNNDKASIIISSMAQGRTLLESLESACVHKASFSMWIMNNEEFSLAFEKARVMRAQHAHEKFYQNTIGELTGELPTEDYEFDFHAKRLAIIEKRQKILGVQKKEDNPTRFSDKDISGQSVSASVAISIDPEYIEKVQLQYKTNLDDENKLDLSRSNEKLESILEADFTEIE